MLYRIWLFLAGLLGGAAVLAAAHGAHGLNSATTFSAAVKIYDTATLYHVVHAIALTLTAVLLAATEGRRGLFATLALNFAAFAFFAGIILFSGGIYYQITRGGGFEFGVPIVPAGGILFMAGWIALAVSAFGFRGLRTETGAQA
jgi:uncharacterized membrane protein YgdD (TMEM256/DUF423 family)